MSKQISLLASLLVIVAVAACGSTPQQGDRTQEVITTSYSQESMTSPANAPNKLALPPECGQGEKVTVVSQDDRVSVCQCAGDGLNVWWGAARNPSVANEPKAQCTAGLLYAFQLHRERVIDLQLGLREAMEVVTTTTSVVPPPPSASAPVAPLPPVPPAASAPAPVATAEPVVKNTVKVEESSIRIEYECATGVVAKRILVTKASKDKTSSREIQTCGGKTITCLTDHSAQQDFNTAPCVCGDKKTQPSQTLGAVWMCPDQ